MISVAFVNRSDTFKPFNLISPVATSENVISYKFSGFEAIGIDYFKVEPEHMTITLDTTGLEVIITSGYENSTSEIWGYSAHFTKDNVSMFNGMIPLASVKHDGNRHTLTFDIYDLIKTLIYLDKAVLPNFTLATGDITGKQLVTNCINAMFANSFPITFSDVSIEMSSANYVGDNYVNQYMALPNRYNFSHFTIDNVPITYHKFTNVFGTDDNYAHDQSSFHTKWFVGFGSWSYRLSVNGSLYPATPQMLAFKIFIGSGGQYKVLIYRWFLNTSNPIINTNVAFNAVPTYGSATENDCKSTMRLLIPDFDAIYNTYCQPSSAMPMSYDSEHGWSLDANIRPLYTPDFIYSPIGHYWPLTITISGTVPEFSPITVPQSIGIYNASTILSSVMQLNNWTLTTEGQNAIKLIDKIKLNNDPSEPIELDKIISAQSMGYSITNLNDYNPDMSFVVNSVNVIEAVKNKYRLLFQSIRASLDITIDGINNLIQHGTKIRYQGKDYYVFGISRDATTTTYKAYGVA